MKIGIRDIYSFTINKNNFQNQEYRLKTKNYFFSTKWFFGLKI